MGVAPWEMLKQPSCWMEWALIAEEAEMGAMQSSKTTHEVIDA